MEAVETDRTVVFGIEPRDSGAFNGDSEIVGGAGAVRHPKIENTANLRFRPGAGRKQV